MQTGLRLLGDAVEDRPRRNFPNNLASAASPSLQKSPAWTSTSPSGMLISVQAVGVTEKNQTHEQVSSRRERLQTYRLR